MAMGLASQPASGFVESPCWLLDEEAAIKITSSPARCKTCRHPAIIPVGYVLQHR